MKIYKTNCVIYHLEHAVIGAGTRGHGAEVCGRHFLVSVRFSQKPRFSVRFGFRKTDPRFGSVSVFTVKVSFAMAAITLLYIIIQRLKSRLPLPVQGELLSE